MSQISTARLMRGIRHYAPQVALDAVLTAFCFAVALVLRFGGRIEDYYLDWFVVASPFIAATYCASAIALNLYRRAWRYAGFPDLAALSASVAVATSVVLAADALIFPREHPLPLTAVVIGGSLTYIAVAATKFAPRIRRFLASGFFARGRVGVLIVGAGQTGQVLAREMLRNVEWSYQPVCFVDDDVRKQGLRIHGVPVRGTSQDISRLVRAYRASVVALAIPTATTAQMRAIIDICHPLAVRLLTVPSFDGVLGGRDGSAVLREVHIEDLLGRAPVDVDLAACRSFIAGRVVLITGAAGSIGSELCRQVLSLKPSTLVLFDSNESGVYDLALELTDSAGSTSIVQCVGSVSNESKVNSVFDRHRPQVVFHAAAYKHVPLMEEYPEEAVRTNVLGTLIVSHAADRYDCERFVLVSTDKAVNPCNVMGATKRLAELTIKDLGAASNTVFCAVRFGNVLGSRGSVVPVFTHQINKGGPITITHPDITRYFMTIPEAVRLIIQAGSFARGGDVFVLDMGEQIKIVDLASKMVRFRGLRVGEDIQITYTGLRPGEKLYEELVTGAETISPTSHPKIRRLSEQRSTPPMSSTVAYLEQLLETADAEELRSTLLDVVTQRSPQIAPLFHSN